MINVEIVKITPELAEAMLGKNHSNRRLRKQAVLMYAKDMKEGRWELTHQGIAFDKNGDLVDGQHRLKAIVDSGVTVRMLVTHGVESKYNLDNHARRILSDSTGYTITKIAMARLILNKLKVGTQELIRTGRASDSLVVEYVEDHYDHLEFADKVMTNNKIGTRISAIRAAVFSASYVEDEGRLAEFADVVITGRYSNYEEDSGAMRLRDWLLSKEAVGHSRSNPTLVYAKAETAIKAFCDRETVSRLRLSNSGNRIYPIPE